MKKNCRNCHNLNLGAKTAFPVASKFENFILLLQLFFELEHFRPPNGISVLGLGNSYHVTDCFQNLHESCSISHLSSKFQAFTFSRLEVITISMSGSGIRKFAQKKLKNKTKKLSTPSVAKVPIKVIIECFMK